MLKFIQICQRSTLPITGWEVQESQEPATQGHGYGKTEQMLSLRRYHIGVEQMAKCVRYENCQ